MVSEEFDHDVAVAFGGRIELIYTITDDWQGGLHARLMQYFEGLAQTSYEYGGTLRFRLRKNSAVVIELSENREFGDAFSRAQLSWQYYF